MRSITTFLLPLLYVLRQAAAQSFTGDCLTLTNIWSAAAPAPGIAPWSTPDAVDCCGFTVEGISIACSETGAITSFTANNQQLTGSLASFAGFPELALLNVANNAFTGELPAGLLSLPSLTSLDVSGNQLTGQVPAVIRLTVMTCNFVGNTLCGSLAGICLEDNLAPCITTTTLEITTVITTTTIELPTIVSTTTSATTTSSTTTSSANSSAGSSVISSTPVQFTQSQPNAISSNLGAIIGGSVGGALFLAVIIAGIIFQNARKRENQKPLTSMASAATWGRIRPHRRDTEDGNYDENSAGPSGFGGHYSTQTEDTTVQSSAEMKPLVPTSRGSADSFDYKHQRT